MAKSFEDAQGSRQEVQSERDHFKHEVVVLSEALGKTKQALAEVQIQRGKLNSTIAKMAQENGDLVREKVSLASELTRIQGDLRASEDQLSLLEVMKDRLEERVQGLEQELALAELNQSSLEESNLTLQQEKHSLSVESDRVGKQKEDQISRMQSENDLELHQSLLQAKAREVDLQGEIKRMREAAVEQVRKLEEGHSLEVSLLTEQHGAAVSRLKEEIDSLKRAHKAEAAQTSREKEAMLSHFEEEKAILGERASRLQQLLDERRVESHHQLLHTSHMAAKQKDYPIVSFK